jgi:hypothetical protein
MKKCEIDVSATQNEDEEDDTGDNESEPMHS